MTAPLGQKVWMGKPEIFMTSPTRFKKIEQRTFFAHHLLLHIAASEIQSSERSTTALGSRSINNYFISMVMSALAVEAIANAVGSRLVSDWSDFERLPPQKKIDHLIRLLGIERRPLQEPWPALRQLAKFRNSVAHPKPEEILSSRFVFEHEIKNKIFEIPASKFERQITEGNARKYLEAVFMLKELLFSSIPFGLRHGIFVDDWIGSVEKC